MDNTKRKPGRPTEDDAINLEHFQRVALKIFAEKGFEATSVKSVADAAGVAHSLLHYHFGNKEGLWKKSVTLVIKELIADYENTKSLFQDLRGVDLLKATIRLTIHYSAKYPEYRQIVMYELNSKSERLDWLMVKIINPLVEEVENIIEESIARKEIRPISIAHLVHMIDALSIYPFISKDLIKSKYNIDIYDPAEVKSYSDSVADILLNGILIK